MLSYLKRLRDQELLSDDDLNAIQHFEKHKPFSLHWELTTLLWLGVILLNTGLGVLIYQNIDTIGHAVLVALIGLLCAACWWYCFRHRVPFFWGAVTPPTPYYDYVVLLGCFTFLIFEGYLQYQYQIFGTRYGLAVSIPMVIFFFLAYLLDHRGVLGLAIVALATWLGINVTPATLWQNNNFESPTLIWTAVLLGATLALGGFLLGMQQRKRHFTNTYQQFSIHLCSISALCGLFVLDQPVVWAFILFVCLAFFWWYARLAGLFYFKLLVLLYGYIGFTWCFFRYSNVWDALDIWGVFLYFLVSAGALIWFLLKRRTTPLPPAPEREKDEVF